MNTYFTQEFMKQFSDIQVNVAEGSKYDEIILEVI
jgi:hypothetical protein